MKDILEVMKQVIKDGNISPQLDNIEFDKTVIAYSDGNIIVAKNETGITGYVNGKELVKVIDVYETPEFVNTSDNLIIKEGKKKVTLAKYQLSGGEEAIQLPQSDKEQSLKINDALVTSLKLCSYSAKGSNLNSSGDGIMIDLDGKFKKVYSSNGETMSVGSIFIKGKGKIFLPSFIVTNILKYATEDSVLSYSDEYVKFDNGTYQFISLYDLTDEQVDVNQIIKSIKTTSKNVEITNDLKNALIEVCNLTDKKVDLRFVKGRVDLTGYTTNGVIENSIDITNEVESEMRLNKSNLKYGASNFDTIDLVNHTENDIDFIKFKKSKINFYISPMAQTEEV